MDHIPDAATSPGHGAAGDLAASARRVEWERKWDRPDFEPAWRIASIPDEVRQAVDDRWFPPGARVLDIGCGKGELAANGYAVTGADFSRSAVALATEAYRDVPGLVFEEVDICNELPCGAPFDALLNRGCLHAVPQADRPSYARQVAAAAKPGARFLLLHHVAHDDSKERITTSLTELLGASFDIVRIQDTVLAVDPRGSPGTMHGVAVWMTRR